MYIGSMKFPEAVPCSVYDMGILHFVDASAAGIMHQKGWHSIKSILFFLQYSEILLLLFKMSCASSCPFFGVSL